MPETIRRYFILIKMSTSEAVSWDERLSEVLNSLPHVSKTQSYATVFTKGVEALEQESLNKFLGEHRKKLAVDAKLRTLEELKVQNEKLNKLFEELGFDAFVEWCDENDVDWQPFLQHYQPMDRGNNREPRWSETALEWLYGFLEDRPRTTLEVRERAIHEGLIGGEDRDWGKLKTLACRVGITGGEKGVWSLLTDNPEGPRKIRLDFCP